MDEKKDLNLLLGMYKNMNKTDEEKVQLMVSEQKLKCELEEVKKQRRRIEVNYSTENFDIFLKKGECVIKKESSKSFFFSSKSYPDLLYSLLYRSVLNKQKRIHSAKSISEV